MADYQYSHVVNKYIHSAEIVNDTDFDLGDRVEIDTLNEAVISRATGGGQYITKIAFDISYEDNVLTVEALDE